MSLRLATRSLARLPIRPACASIGLRYNSTSTEPKAKAASIIDALPGSSIVSKTGILATSAAAAVYAVSHQLYVVNEESTLLAVFISFLFVFSKFAAPGYKEWADSYIANVKKVLNDAKENHVVAVKDRIESVGQLKDVVGITESLFDVSKETAKLEAEAFELKQKVDYATAAKSVLDSWVRYESQVRQKQQQELAKSVIAKVQAEIENPKFQQAVLNQSVSEIEALFKEAK